MSWAVVVDVCVCVFVCLCVCGCVYNENKIQRKQNTSKYIAEISVKIQLAQFVEITDDP
jgi:delta-aminolevulinic acid dehydratase/porphobilinogen synthase